MGFISFNENFYRGKIESYENRELSDAEIYEARQLLKVLDDLTDEGYTNLNDRMEADFSCLTRLKTILRNAGAEPFPIGTVDIPAALYSDEEYKLSAIIDSIATGSYKYFGSAFAESMNSCESNIQRKISCRYKTVSEVCSKDKNKLHGYRFSAYPLCNISEKNKISENPFLNEIKRYCEWVGCEDDIAYIFLLRDSLLPYLFFSNAGKKNLYPWLISRRFLEDITETEFVDDDIRLPIYDALEEGHTEFDVFFDYCKPKMLAAIEGQPKLKTELLNLLSSVPQRKITVIESGYMGTIPMMLKVLDDRVDFKLFTSAPFLYETYKDKIFCRRYEDIRKFETLYSQEYLMRYSSYQDKEFYVNLTTDKQIQEKALEEIRYFIKQ